MKFQMMGDEKSGKKRRERTGAINYEETMEAGGFFRADFLQNRRVQKSVTQFNCVHRYVEIGGTLEQLFFFLLLWTAESPTLPQVLR
jgi:hypothetical protein